MDHMSQEEYQQGKKDVYRTTIILSIVTVGEVLGSIVYEHYIDGTRWPLMLFVTVMSIVKAFWIMKVFMHVGHEKKGFVFTLLFPFVFLIWAIISFSTEGSSINLMRESLNGIFF
jgi:cytochrome c oxidase subunit 4